MAGSNLASYKFNHSMIRIKDPQASVKFYETLGMKLINKISQPEAKFDLYFMAYDGPDAVSYGKHWTDREGIVELTHNYGSESDSNFRILNGNADEGKGFGHLCISVDHIQAACKRLEDAGYKFQKRLTDGRMRSIAFILDPDGYWVEIIPQKPIETTEQMQTTDLNTYRMNHTMIRVKDAQKSIKFYQENFGMTLKRTSENPSAEFNLYFLGYGEPPSKDLDANGVNPQANSEGLLELTWNYGTEKDPSFKYYDGNSGDIQGFGHTCVTTDNVEAACEQLEAKGVKFSKRLKDGRMHNLAFALDPDGYKIEIIQNEALKA